VWLPTIVRIVRRWLSLMTDLVLLIQTVHVFEDGSLDRSRVMMVYYASEYGEGS
jgi:hypothetical protein